ncbi:MAG: hypothetical protein K6T99_00360 [Armatimonadetes bacterium]|nr:hypothetical protein [Armatimonadota bacterium]
MQFGVYNQTNCCLVREGVVCTSAISGIRSRRLKLLEDNLSKYRKSVLEYVCT